MSRCSFCDSSVSRKQSVFCSGPCKKLFHFECAKIPGDLVPYLSSVAGLQWNCYNCRNSDSKCDTKKILESIDKRCNDMFMEFGNKFESLKNELEQMLIRNGSVSHSSTSIKPSYAQVCKPLEKIVVKPKNPNQIMASTKSDLMQTLNPADLDFHIGKVEHTRDGGIILGCSHSDGIAKLKDIAQKELSSKYDVRVLKSARPQVRIVGMGTCYSDCELKNYLVKQNPQVFSEKSEIQIIRSWPTKKDKNVFQSLIQLDPSTFDIISSSGNILIGYDKCTVFEAFDIPRCFNCNGFFHTKKFCKCKTRCPICAKEHDVKECPPQSITQCINCLNLKESNKIDIAVNHAAWDYEKCVSFKNATQKFKNDLFGAPRK